MSDLTTQIEEAMAMYADRADAAAALLRAVAPALPQAQGAQQLAWLRAAEHVLLGHLADAAGLAALLSALPAAQTPRARAAIALAAGAVPDWQDLAPAERIRAHYNAALARTRHRDFSGLTVLMDAAQACVARDDKESARAWAAMANNLAADLRACCQPGDRAAAAAMLDAATRARSAWQAAGGWLEQERADWQLALCAAAAGAGAPALQAAQRCVQACQSNEADDDEHCFAFQALGLAALAVGDLALARHAQALMAERVLRLAGDDRAYADDCLVALTARLEAEEEAAAG